MGIEDSGGSNPSSTFTDASEQIPEWLQNGSPNLPKAVQKSVSFFDRFFHRFLDRSWGPKSLKMSTSCTREAHFHKIAFSDSDIFLEAKVMKKGSPNGAQIHPKINKNTYVLLVVFSIRFCINFRINFDPTDPPFWCSRLGAVQIL